MSTTSNVDYSVYSNAFNVDRNYFHKITSVYWNGDGESWHSLDVVMIYDGAFPNGLNADELCETVSEFFRGSRGAGMEFERSASVHYVSSGYDATGAFYTFTVARSGGLDI